MSRTERPTAETDSLNPASPRDVAAIRAAFESASGDMDIPRDFLLAVARGSPCSHLRGEAQLVVPAQGAVEIFTLSFQS